VTAASVSLARFAELMIKCRSRLFSREVYTSMFEINPIIAQVKDMRERIRSLRGYL